MNAGLRDLLKRHRGMSEEHRRRAAARAPKKQRPKPREESGRPALYGTGLDAGEGIWEPAGWAGRS